MAIYQRMTMVQAIQFKEEEYRSNPLMFPDVWDKGSFSELWSNKTAKDGRYYLTNQPNTNIGEPEYITVSDEDYIIREESGISYTIPKEVFEKNFEWFSDSWRH